MPPVLDPGTGTSFVFMFYGAVVSGNTDTITFQAELPFNGITVGSPIKIEFGFFDNQASIGSDPNAQMIDGADYDVKLEVNGFVLYHEIYTATTGGSNVSPLIMKGLNLNSSVANTLVTIKYSRDANVDQSLYIVLRAYQYSNAYDPTTGCCPTSCPAQTGLDVQIDPPVCVYCNTLAGLVYSPSNGTCACKPGFYLDSSKTFQCFPCEALFCDICRPGDPKKCITCATGGILDTVS